jgi:hypothetical protein
MKNIFYTALIIFSLVMSPIAARAQVASGGNFTLEQSVIAGGGATNSSGGNFTLAGTIGQSIAGDAMSGSSFDATSGFWNSTQSAPNVPLYEADIAARPNGDGLIVSNDVVQIRKFLNGTDTPNQTTNEFQRADSSPFATRGDGKIFSDDVVQARRYQNGTNPKQLAAGPMTQSAARPDVDSLFAGTAKTVLEKAVSGVNQELRVESASGSAGQTVTVNIHADAQGDESEYGFILNYQSDVLTNPTVGAGSAGASVRSCNTGTAGQLNCSVGGFPNNNPTSTESGIGEIAAGTNQILVTVTFTVASNAAGDTPLTLSNVNASSDAPQLFIPTATNGVVTILAPTAASVSVSGRVLNANGKGIRNVQLTLISASGESQTVLSGASGYYRFTEVASGQTCVLTVSARKYTFANPTQVLNVNEELSEINFVADN